MPADALLRDGVDSLLQYSYALSGQKPLWKKMPPATLGLLKHPRDRRLPRTTRDRRLPRPPKDRRLPPLPLTLLAPAAPAPPPPRLEYAAQAQQAWERRLQAGIWQLIHLALSLEKYWGTQGSSPDSSTEIEPDYAKEGLQETAPYGR